MTDFLQSVLPDKQDKLNSAYTQISLDELSRFLGAAQADPRHFIAFLAAGEADIRLEIPATFGSAWPDRVVLAFEHGTLIGCMLLDFDVSIKRVWVYGPFVQTEDATRWSAIADTLWAESQLRLMALLAEALPESSTTTPIQDHGRLDPRADFRFDLFIDAENVNAAAFAARHGFAFNQSFAILWLERAAWARMDSAAEYAGEQAIAPVRPFRPADAEGFATLHSAFFPNTYALPEAIIAKQQPGPTASSGATAQHAETDQATDDTPDQELFIYARPTAESAATDVSSGNGREEVLGYAWVELEPSGDAYLHYIGVAEKARRSGIGQLLLRAVVNWAFAHPDAIRVNLVVLSNNTPAIALYKSFGFTYERTAVSYRLGAP